MVQNSNGIGNGSATTPDTVVNIDNSMSDNASTTSAAAVDNALKNKSSLWKQEHEKILSEWADKAMCYRWMHFKSFKIYQRKVHMYTIPVIIISTLTGTANFATSSFTWAYTSSIIGAFNIIAGIVTTIQQFLKINELNASHRIAALSWDKFYRNIKVELSKHVDDRISAYQMIKIYKEEYDRLMETCPMISRYVIDQFNRQFKHTDFFSEVQKPEICNVLIPTSFYIYKDPELTLPSSDEQDDLINELKTPSEEQIRAESVIAKFRDTSNKILGEKKVFDKFISEFEQINMRKPTRNEIITNLKSKIDVNTINKFLSSDNIV